MPIALVAKETDPGETRVAAVPETVKRLVEAGLDVRVEPDAGAAAYFPDDKYVAAGATLAEADDWGRAELILKVQPPSPAELARIRESAILVSFVHATDHREVVELLREGGITSLAMELVPRITRAQSMDALSSQATVAGYKAVLLGASHLAKLCPLMMTAAGTIPPARVVVFGAGVAGLQAIATARRQGCLVEATDIRLAAKEQVESLGARFIDVPGAEDMEGEGGYAKEVTKEFLARQQEEVAKRVAEADLVITTALVPGRRAPVLITGEMVKSMRPGAVIVDLAVEAGGNCALSVCGEIVQRHGVTLVGIPNLAATVPQHASELYSKNVLALCKLIVGDEGKLDPDFEDDVLAGCLLTRNKDLVHAQTAERLAAEVKS